MQKGFDNERYIELQSQHIRERINMFGGKLYLEFGGKLFDDYHASRVLPGFEPDSKIRMLQSLSSDAEIIITINASDIEKNKVRGDLGITYDEDVLRLCGIFKGLGFGIGGVVITRYAAQAGADAFRRRLDATGIPSFVHYSIPGYPADVERIVSDEGYGKNEFVPTQKPLVVVTAPGPGSGKMAVCLSQLYHENLRGNKAGYAKFETFPIWNLPLAHPVNIAYEAATADLDDMNMIDPFHLEAYGKTTVNYNRDVEVFPVVRAMFERMGGTCPYKSPTDMGVNMAGFAIFDDEACCTASRLEILYRYYTALKEDKLKGGDGHTVEKMRLLMNRARVSPDFFPAIAAAKAKDAQTGAPAGATVLPNGAIVTGKTSPLLGAAAALLLNALKATAGIPDEQKIISPAALEPICELKTKYLKHHNPRLHSDEVLIALTVSATENPLAAKALAALDTLRGTRAHFTVILSPADEKTYKQLGILTTSEPITKQSAMLKH
ncbi:MAG: DUF1846 domain-containing protein [Clostridia bacterium]|nr:DUF1846 domain-containing protein [Clostridia bacterium]